MTKTDAEILALLDERDLRFYDETRVAYKSAHITAGDVLRDENRPMHLDTEGAATLAHAIREFMLPNADDHTRYRLWEVLNDCPKVQR